jgi:thiol-disulfide isomerase/thioredoxin
MMGVESKTRTKIAYKSIRINQPVADALFTFVPPANAKEVDSFSMPELPSRRLQNKPAPEFSLTTVEGKNASLTDFKGKTVLLDFWATWCLPCRESTPMIEKFQSAFSDKGLVALAVNAGEEAEVVQGYLAHNPNKLSNLVDPRNKIANLYDVDSFPSFVLISRDGKVVYSSSGFSAESEAQLRAALKQEGFQ